MPLKVAWSLKRKLCYHSRELKIHFDSSGTQVIQKIPMIYFFTMETFFSFISKLLMFPGNQSSYCNYLLTKYPNIIIIKIILFNLFNNIKYHLWHPLYGCLFSILRIFTIYHILNFTYLPQKSKLFKKGFINIFLYYEAFSF